MTDIDLVTYGLIVLCAIYALTTWYMCDKMETMEKRIEHITTTKEVTQCDCPEKDREEAKSGETG